LMSSSIQLNHFSGSPYTSLKFNSNFPLNILNLRFVSPCIIVQFK
jgi:hypothetical protein